MSVSIALFNGTDRGTDNSAKLCGDLGLPGDEDPEELMVGLCLLWSPIRRMEGERSGISLRPPDVVALPPMSIALVWSTCLSGCVIAGRPV